MNTDYFENFIDKSDFQQSEKPRLPNWVSEKNSSKKAFLAIQTLYKKKLEYISKHSKKEHFNRKSTYQISKSAVARFIGKSKPNAIFHTVDYAVHLTSELREKNEALFKSYQKAIRVNKKGKQGYTKQKLVRVLQETEQELKVISEQTLEEVLERSIERLSMPVRRQLGLI